MSTPPDTASFRVLFVCTGNTCRSPLAEAMARRAIEARDWTGIEVGSAGVAAVEGAPASEGSRRVGERHGLDLSSHRSRSLTPALAADADLILTMSVEHLRVVERYVGDRKGVLLSAFAEGREGADGEAIPDPFGGSDDVYEETYEVLDDLVRRSVDHLAPLAEAETDR